MAILPITVWGEPVLHQRAREVEEITPEIRSLVQDMYETLDAADGVGLAAPQIGVGLRIFVYSYDDDREDETEPWRGVVINPVLTHLPAVMIPDDDSRTGEEGCLSFPGIQLQLARSNHVRVEGIDLDGSPVRIEAIGWRARILQHEYDHLDGYLYVDRLAPKYAKKANKWAHDAHWGIPGITWDPRISTFSDPELSYPE